MGKTRSTGNRYTRDLRKVRAGKYTYRGFEIVRFDDEPTGHWYLYREGSDQGLGAFDYLQGARDHVDALYALGQVE